MVEVVGCAVDCYVVDSGGRRRLVRRWGGPFLFPLSKKLVLPNRKRGGAIMRRELPGARNAAVARAARSVQ